MKLPNMYTPCFLLSLVSQMEPLSIIGQVCWGTGGKSRFKIRRKLGIDCVNSTVLSSNSRPIAGDKWFLILSAKGLQWNSWDMPRSNTAPQSGERGISAHWRILCAICLLKSLYWEKADGTNT
jgi:hypothetical protein